MRLTAPAITGPAITAVRAGTTDTIIDPAVTGEALSGGHRDTGHRKAVDHRDTDLRKAVDRAARRICHRGCDRGAAGRVAAAGGGAVDADPFLQATTWQQ